MYFTYINIRTFLHWTLIEKKPHAGLYFGSRPPSLLQNLRIREEGLFDLLNIPSLYHFNNVFLLTYLKGISCTLLRYFNRIIFNSVYKYVHQTFIDSPVGFHNSHSRLMAEIWPMGRKTLKQSINQCSDASTSVFLFINMYIS